LAYFTLGLYKDFLNGSNTFTSLGYYFSAIFVGIYDFFINEGVVDFTTYFYFYSTIFYVVFKDLFDAFCFKARDKGVYTYGLFSVLLYCN
jgi:hypothetical protein